ncbi:MAG: TadE/TadG family type IV pilus assembly protein [Candidatus Sulfotelmatobacter sp.]
MRSLTALARRLLRDDCAAQLVEFAVALPLLMVFVVGIFDFSGAFTIKQKLTNAARDAARAAAADPATDLANSGTTPASVIDAFQVADTYLTTNNLNDCGLTIANLSAAGGLTWSASSGTCPPTPGMNSISINRGQKTTGSIGGVSTYIIETQVQIQYAYAWHFNRVIGILVNGATYAGLTTLTVKATAMNEN